MDNYFNTLNSVNVNDKIEKKNGLSYLSWAYAWGEVKKRFPDATYKIYENAQGWFYHTDDTTCWVKTGVTINGIEHIEYLPVMDNRNRSIKVQEVTSFDVNKAIQRSLTKACARHGLGLYIYAGEDLPDDEQDAETKPKAKQETTLSTPASPSATDLDTAYHFLCNGKELCKYSLEQLDWLRKNAKNDIIRKYASWVYADKEMEPIEINEDGDMPF